MDAIKDLSSQTAVVLIVMGAIAILLEVLVPGGIAGFLGAAAVLLGLYSLGVLSAVWAVATLAVFTLGLIAFAVPAIRSRRYPRALATEQLVGSVVTARTDIAPEGVVAAAGALWKATSQVPIGSGDKVKVVAREGLVLRVEPADG